jgi:hypothetical protein
MTRVHFQVQKHWITHCILQLALRAIGFADVRFGALPTQSGPRRDDERREEP